MTVYLDELSGIVRMKKGKNPEDLVHDLRENVFLDFCNWYPYEKDVHLDAYGEVSSVQPWTKKLSEYLDEYCDEWHLEAFPEYPSSPVLFCKKGSTEEIVEGQRLALFPGHEEDLLEHLPRSFWEKVLLL